MSCEDHEAFRAGSNLNGEPTYYTTAYDQIEKVKQLADLDDLWQIQGDLSLGISVRKAAERRMRVLDRKGTGTSRFIPATDAHGQAQTPTDGHAVPAKEGAV